MLTKWLLVLMLVLSAAPASAASLYWDGTADGFLELEYSASCTDQFVLLGTIQAHPSKYPLAPGKFGCYRLTLPDGGASSNWAYFSLDIETGWLVELQAMEARVSALETTVPPPPPTTGPIVTTLSPTQIAVTCANGMRPSQQLDGSGLKRILTCSP
jgi:hypothetical protein